MLLFFYSNKKKVKIIEQKRTEQTFHDIFVSKTDQLKFFREKFKDILKQKHQS